MWRLPLLLLAACFLLKPDVSLDAEDRPVFSGPQPGETLAPLRVLVSTEKSDVETVDLVSISEGKPLLFVFVHNVTRPSAALARTLTNYAQMRQDDGLFAAVIYLTDDPSRPPRGVGGRARGGRSTTIRGVSPDGKEGPGSYGLNRNVEVTVLVGKDGRVTANFALVQPSVTDAPKVIAAITELIGGRVPSAPEIEFLSMNQYAAEKFRENGVAPRDPKLREKICEVLYAQAEPDTLDASAKAVEIYVGGDAGRQRELGEAARVLLHSRYKGTVAIVADSPARDRIREWAEKFGSKASGTSKRGR